MKKEIVPTLWLLGAVIALYNAWIYYQDGNTGFVYVQMLSSVLFLIHAIRGYIQRTNYRYAKNQTITTKENEE